MIFDPVRRYALEADVPRHGNSHRHLGLGLFITHKIIMAHGGTIRSTSSAAEGSTFAIWLPLLRTA